jgi:hypothetical protein
MPFTVRLRNALIAILGILFQPSSAIATDWGAVRWFTWSSVSTTQAIGTSGILHISSTASGPNANIGLAGTLSFDMNNDGTYELPLSGLGAVASRTGSILTYDLDVGSLEGV